MREIIIKIKFNVYSIYMNNDYKNLYKKYKYKYLNLKKEKKQLRRSSKKIFSSIKSLYNSIISLMDEDYIKGISIFEANDNIYILIGEVHVELERKTNNSFTKIYNNIIKGKYSVNNIDVFVESQINLSPLINSKDLSNYKKEDSETTINAFRRITQYKPNNNLNIQPHYIDIRDNSVFFWLDLAFGDKLNVKLKNEIIKNIFILIYDNYIRYLKLLISKTEIKSKENRAKVNTFLNMTSDNISDNEDKFIQNGVITHEQMSFLCGSVINPYILAKMYSTELPIKILYGGLNHIKIIDKELKKQDNVKIHFNEFKE